MLGVNLLLQSDSAGGMTETEPYGAMILTDFSRLLNEQNAPG